MSNGIRCSLLIADRYGRPVILSFRIPLKEFQHGITESGFDLLQEICGFFGQSSTFRVLVLGSFCCPSRLRKDFPVYSSWLLFFSGQDLVQLIAEDSTANLVQFIVIIATIIPSLAVCSRRLHDSNKSGWCLLLSLIPFGAFVVLYWLTRPGTEGTNRFGDGPNAIAETNQTGEFSADVNPQKPIAIVEPIIAVGAALGQFAGIQMALIFSLGSVADITKWYDAGGFVMPLLALMTLMQILVIAVFGTRSLRKPLGIGLCFLAPSAAVLVGLWNYQLGLIDMLDFGPSAPLDARLGMWLVSGTISRIPLHMSYVVMGMACLGWVVIGLLQVFHWRKDDVIENRDHAASGALLSSGAGLCAASFLSVGLEAISLDRGIEAMYFRPPHLRWETVMMYFEQSRHVSSQNTLVLGVVTTLALTLLFCVRDELGGWFLRRKKEAVMVVAILGSLLLIEGGMVSIEKENTRQILSEYPVIPEGIELSRAPAGLNGQVINVEETQLLLLSSRGLQLSPQGDVFGIEQSSFDRLKEALVTTLKNQASETIDSVAEPGTRIPPCEGLEFPKVALAMDYQTSLTDVNRILSGIRRIGGCQLMLLNREDWNSGKTREEEQAELAVVDPMHWEMIEAARLRATPVVVTQSTSRGTTKENGLGLLVQWNGEKASVTSHHKEFNRTDLSPEDLSEHLTKIKDVFPKEEEVWVEFKSKGTLQEACKVLAVTQRYKGANGKVSDLFGEVRWVVP